MRRSAFPLSEHRRVYDDVVEWRCQSSWHYSEEMARQRVKDWENRIIERYDLKAPIDLSTLEAGYYFGDVKHITV